MPDAIKKFLPLPLLSFGLLLMWLLLNQSLHPSHILLGLLFALAIPPVLRPLMPFRARIRRPFALARFIVGATVEIVRSCFNVGQVILFSRSEGVNSEFIRVPLTLRDPVGLAVLSCAINSTPGTVWVEVLEESHELVLHVFDLHDAQWWIDTIQISYERPLIEIFEGKPS